MVSEWTHEEQQFPNGDPLQVNLPCAEPQRPDGVIEWAVTTARVVIPQTKVDRMMLN
jgi:hypothetical protein